MNLSRRRFLRALVTGLAVPASAAAWSTQAEPFWPEFPVMPLPVANLPAAFAGIRIAHLSDLHVCSPTSEAFARAVVAHVNALRPDVAFVTGDLVTQGRGYIDQACAAVAGLRVPTYVSLGNHDYSRQAYQGRTVDSAEEITARLRDAGCVVLRNEAARLERGGGRLTVVGLEDLWSGRFAPGQTFAGIDPAEGPILALSHNPDTGAALNNYGVSWVFAGHTHGGQVRVPGFGAVFLNVQNRALQQGRIRMSASEMYISRGVGHLTPVRLFCRPEVPIFVAQIA